MSAVSASNHQSGYFSYHGLWAPGIRLFRVLSFNAKASIIGLTLMVPTLILVAWLLKSHGDEALQARMAATRQHVEVARSTLVWAHEQETSGKLTREQAQATARQIIARMRYDGKEYFWINDLQLRMIMYPFKPELDGQDVSGIKDPNGLAVFKAFVETVQRAGQGFVTYQWPRPGQQIPVDKLSYVAGFEPWGWVIGSGIYISDLHETQWSLTFATVVVIAASLLVGGYLFVSFYRVMNGGLRETRRHLHAMTEGDLTTTPFPWGKDEAAELMTDLKHMQDSLRGMVHKVRLASEDIVHASSGIASGAMDLSSRTEQAAANLEESASSMEQMSSTVRNTSALTEEASKVARRNAQAAADGGRVMREVVQTMEAIRGSSAKIGEIIGTIDGIAFQTNILALNAAVEAARAGDQGRGFAVVASEVRMLARRSADAAREIKSLISSSVEQVEGGAEVVRKAGGAIDDITAASQHVDRILDEMAVGAREQSTGIGQIGQAVQELDRMTQQNAALVEETAASASAMSDQACALASEVARFRLP